MAELPLNLEPSRFVMMQVIEYLVQRDDPLLPSPIFPILLPVALRALTLTVSQELNPFLVSL